MTNKVAFINENDNDSHLDLQEEIQKIFSDIRSLEINNEILNEICFIYCLLWQSIALKTTRKFARS